MDDEKQLKKSFFLRLRKNLVKAGNDSALAGRVARPLHVGRVLQQRQHAALAVLGKGVQVECLVVERRKIDLEVAGMNDHAHRRLDRQRHAIHQRVRHADGLDGERPDGELHLRLDLDQLDLVEQLMLFQLAFHVGQRELGGVHRNLELAQDPRQAADVVLVPVRQHNGAHMLLVLNQVGDVGDNNVDAQQLRLGEHQARVDHNNVVFPAHCQAVHSELAQPAQGNDLQLFCLHLCLLMLPPRGGREGLLV